MESSAGLLLLICRQSAFPKLALLSVKLESVTPDAYENTAPPYGAVLFINLEFVMLENPMLNAPP